MFLWNMSLLLTSYCSVFTVEFQQVNAQWVAPYTIAMEVNTTQRLKANRKSLNILPEEYLGHYWNDIIQHIGACSIYMK